MKKKSVLMGLAIFMAVAMALASLPLLALGQGGNTQSTCPNSASTATSASAGQINAVAYHDEWRHLWEDHVWYTRETITDILTSSPDTNASIDRLIMVANDTRDMLRPFYGAQADVFYTQLVGHFTIAAQIVTGVSNGADVTPLVNDWFANARNMSMIMQQMNPQFWAFGPVNAMWDQHLNLTIQEATQFAKGQFGASIATFDLIENQGLMMADLFSNGIMNQFPGQFSNQNCITSLNTTM
jgi:hypothetical protein